VKFTQRAAGLRNNSNQTVARSLQERRFRAQYDNIRVRYAAAMGANGSALIQRLGLSLPDYAHAAMGVRTYTEVQ
jgi:hypothetical protein